VELTKGQNVYVAALQSENRLKGSDVTRGTSWLVPETGTGNRSMCHDG